MKTVKYEAMRRHVRSGDLLAFEARSLVGRLIRTVTGSRYAHVGIAMWLMAEGAPPRLFVIESRTGRGVSMRLLSSAGDCWLIPTGMAWSPDVNRFVWPLIGTADYDWLSALFRRTSRNACYYCSEFAGEVLQRGGLAINEDDFADPGELVHAVLRVGPGRIVWMSNRNTRDRRQRRGLRKAAAARA